ncbi:hypothetical protein JOC77_001396 [Peribacillus deserti]|uniref:Uncharacterized protein n=1 Tax=Peribacillus deserti TaxID=673318 RepID=A0ABS2QFQ7_9BACI|nr:hypothetical protein [Peribacillus deserti]MBM7691986.1 hypothetical protein [Peribacillus deserti]
MNEYRLRTTLKLIEKQTPERHKTSGSERPLLPFDGDWLMTGGVSPSWTAGKVLSYHQKNKQSVNKAKKRKRFFLSSAHIHFTAFSGISIKIVTSLQRPAAHVMYG